MWPFILNTVSLWPSVRKWLLILALNLQPVSVKRRAAEVRDEGSWVSWVPARCSQDHSSVPPPRRRRVPLRLQIKTIGPASVWWLKIRAISMRAHVSLSLFAGMWLLEEERKVEWQLDGSHNKTVIERYVIVAISGWSKWYQRDISV